MDIDEKSIAMAMDSSKDAILVLDVDAHIVFINQSCATKLRAEKVSSMGKKLATVVDAEIYESIKRYIDEAIECKGHVSFISHMGDYVFQNTITPVMDKGDGVKYVVVHIIDMTELELLKKFISRIDLYYKDIIDDISDGIGLADANGDITYVNSYMEVITNKKQRDIIGKNLFLISRINEDPSECNFPCIKHFDFKDVCGNDKHIKLEIKKKEMDNHDMGYYFVLSDISEQQRYHECITLLSKQRNKRIWELNKMAMKFNHDMQTPLTTIYGYAESMLDSLEKGDHSTLEDDCRIISYAAEKMFALNKDMKKACEEISTIGCPG